MPHRSNEAAKPPSAQSRRPIATIALIGFMGAGKSTVGQGLAEHLGWPFLDLDQLIEQRDGRKIEQIFREAGEEAFRSLEQQLLRESLAGSNAGCCVLALGGGAFAQPEIRRLLLDAQVPSVFLDADAEELFRRSEQPSVIRPLRRDLKQFTELYEARREFYNQAELWVQTQGKDVGSVIEEIISRLDLGLSSGENK